MTRPEAILAIIRDGPHTARELSEKTGFSVVIVQRAMCRLRNSGHAKRLDDQAAGKPAIWAWAGEKTLRKRRDTIWEQQPDLLKQAVELYGLGLSHSEIAKRIGHGVSRNAVIGKLGRIGVRSESRINAQRSVARIRQPAREHAPRVIASAPAKRKAPTMPMADLLPDSRNLLVTQLTSQTCRFATNAAPFGGEHLFCGAGVVLGRPYCSHHERMAHQPAKTAGDRSQRLAAIR